MTPARPIAAILGLGLALGLAQAIAAAEVSPEARRLLDDVARAYKALPAYADHGELSLSVTPTPGRPPTTRTTPARVSLARPDRLAIDAGAVRVVSDGKTLRTIVPPLATFRDVPAPARVSMADLDDGPLGALEYGGPQGRAFRLVLSFLLDDDPVKGLVDDARAIRLGPGIKRDGPHRDAIVYVPQVGPTLTLWVDPATRLLDRIDVALVPDGSASGLVPGSPIVVDSLRWTSGAVAAKAADADFTLTKPAGFAEIAKLAKDVARKAAEHEMVGQPSPDFTLNVLDGAGKTRRVTKADLAGKVVLIDFWATWCGPCLTELPDIQTLIADYAKAGKPVAVVALSIDQSEDGATAEVRALVEKTLKEKAIALESPPVGVVALDPSGSIARAFKVQAIPHLVVIDPKGTVRHVHVGVTERGVLVGEIDGLLGVAKP